MSDVSPNNLRGIAIPLKINADWIWTTEASITQQGNQTGVPVPNQDDGVVLTGHGEQTADTSYTVQTQQGGSVADRATFIFREGSTGDYYGRDNAGALSFSSNLRFSASFAAKYPDCVTLDDGSVLACYQVDNGKQIYVAKWTASAGWVETLVLTFTTLITPGISELYPTICKLSDGSLLIAFWYADTDAGVATIRTFRSTDDGATWAEYSDDCLRDAIDISGSPGAGATGYDLRRLRMRAINGQILLIAEVYAHDTSGNREQAYQYASTNNGTTFEFVALINSTNGNMRNVQSPDITVTNGAFYVAFADNTIADPNRLYVMPLTNAFESINNAWSNRTEVATQCNVSMQGHIALWTDKNGFMYIAFASSVDNRKRIYVSTDVNASWVRFSTSVYRTDAATEALTFATGCESQGRNILITGVQSTVGTVDNGIFAHWLGGYSNVTLPASAAVSLAVFDYACLDYNWSGFWIPDDGTWTKGGSGGGTIAAAGMNLTTTTATGTLCTYSQTPTTSAFEGLLARVRVTCSTGGTAASNRRIIRLRYHDTTTHEITLRLGTVDYGLYDGNSAQIGSNISVDMTNGIDFIIALADAKCSIWHRIADLDDNVRTWANDFDAVTVPAGGTASNLIQFGHATVAATGTTDSIWHELHYSEGLSTGFQLAQGFGNPEDLHGAEYPAQGNTVYLNDGVEISTAGGFAGKGESNTIDTKYRYPIDNAFYEFTPSPRLQWRSTKGAIISNVPEQFLPFYANLSVGSNENTRLDSDLLCFYLDNINFAEFDIEYYDGAAWQVAAAIDTRKTSSFNRYGANVEHKTGGAFAGYYHYDDLAGGFVELGTRGSGKIRQISGNTEGVWDESSTGKRTMLTLDGIDGTELATGSIEIYPNKCCVVISQLQTEATAWGIRIKTNRTTTGDFRIGNLTIAPVYIFAPQYARGRSIEQETNTETLVQNDGTQRSRFRSAGRRVVQINFSDGLDTTGQFNDTTTNLNFYAAESTNEYAIANLNDVPFSMLNIIKRVAGSRDSVVYLPRIPFANTVSEETRVLTGHNESILVNIDSNIQIRNVLGDEFESSGGELMRVSTITMREVE